MTYLLVSPRSVEGNDALLATAFHLALDHNPFPFIKMRGVYSFNFKSFKIIPKLICSSSETIQPSFVKKHHSHRKLLNLHIRHILTPDLAFQIKPLTVFQNSVAVKTGATIYVIPDQAHPMRLPLFEHLWLGLNDSSARVQNKCLLAVLIIPQIHVHINRLILPGPTSNEELVVHQVDNFSPVFLKFEIFVLDFGKVVDMQSWLW